MSLLQPGAISCYQRPLLFLLGAGHAPTTWVGILSSHIPSFLCDHPHAHTCHGLCHIDCRSASWGQVLGTLLRHFSSSTFLVLSRGTHGSSASVLVLQGTTTPHHRLPLSIPSLWLIPSLIVLASFCTVARLPSGFCLPLGASWTFTRLSCKVNYTVL